MLWPAFAKILADAQHILGPCVEHIGQMGSVWIKAKDSKDIHPKQPRPYTKGEQTTVKYAKVSRIAMRPKDKPWLHLIILIHYINDYKCT